MRRVLSLVVRLSAVVLLLLSNPSVAQAGPPHSALAVTGVCGTLNADATWTAANSPYDVCTSGLTVAAGVTLTIQPGVTVEFDNNNNNKLNVIGNLVAVGTQALPILFTGVVQSPNSWGGLNLNGSVATPASASLDFVTVEYAAIGASAGEIFSDHANLTMDHSTVRNSAGNGLLTTGSTQINVRNTTFSGNAQNAVFLSPPPGDIALANLSASGNGADVVRLGGLSVIVHGNRRWSNPGIPYLVDVQVINQAGDILSMDPGTLMRFTGGGFLTIGGELDALGTAGEPIVMTGATPSPGAWRGLSVYGGGARALAQLDYVTLEYGGSDINGANILVSNGALDVRDSIIRNSQKDGVRFDSNATGSLLNTQITGNTLYGVRNTAPTRAVLASNNWWGDPGGPISDLAACPSGLGDRVTAGVLYIPVQAASGASANFPLTSAPSITLSPRRWVTPADGLTRVYFDITLVDGNGAPISGRTIRLHTNLGTLTDGGVTDANGKTFAYLVSSGVGDATVYATLDGLTGCEAALSPQSTVTFTTPVNITDLFPNAAAPYMDNDLGVSPMPVTVGVQTNIVAHLTNPLPSPITVDVSFGFAQAGIGLQFGPIKDYTGQVIPANSSLNLSAAFTPVVSGHYCVQVTYTVTAVGAAAVRGPLAGGSGSTRRNLNVYQAPTSSSGKNNSLDKTRNSLKQVNRFVNRAYDTGPIAIPLAVANRGIAWDLNTAEQISNSLQGDPPRQDYTQITLPQKLELAPIQTGSGVSAARAAALNALDDALAQANAAGKAAAIAFDRYGGASEAQDLQWASIQSAAMLEYNREMGAALVTAAQKIDDVIAVAASEGDTSVIVTVNDVIAMQAALASGFSAQAVADAHALGYSDADIEAVRQNILAARPEDLAGDLVVAMQGIRDRFLELGNVLQKPYTFAPGFSVTGSAGLLGAPQAAATGNSMAQVHSNVSTVMLANPLTQTATINLSARAIELPADWGVTVSPAQVTLAAGAQTTVAVSVSAGSPVPQGSTPRVAVEGYANGQLLGGVAVELLVPRYVYFDGVNTLLLHTFLPMIKR